VQNKKCGDALNHAAEVVEFLKGKRLARAALVITIAQPLPQHRVPTQPILPHAPGYVAKADFPIEVKVAC
jgi:hypothetical protein